jgi:flagellar motor component MotA
MKTFADFYQSLNCMFTKSEKEKSIPVINRMTELATVARCQGLLSLYDELQGETNTFLKNAVMQVINVVEIDDILESLQIQITADSSAGLKLLERLIIMLGTLEIAIGQNPRIVQEKLFALLGEDYIEGLMETDD